jgi:hypothetical protein
MRVHRKPRDGWACENGAGLRLTDEVSGHPWPIDSFNGFMGSTASSRFYDSLAREKTDKSKEMATKPAFQ